MAYYHRSTRKHKSPDLGLGENETGDQDAPLAQQPERKKLPYQAEIVVLLAVALAIFLMFWLGRYL